MGKKDRKRRETSGDGKGVTSGKEPRQESAGAIPAETVSAPAPALKDSSIIRIIIHPVTLAGLTFLLALWTRMYVAHFYAKGPDNFQYLSLAQDIASGDYFKKDFDLDAGLALSRRVVPFYPALVAIVIKLGADPEKGATWVSIIMDALTALPLFGVGLILGDKWSAAVACLFFAVMPPILFTSGQILTEPTFAFLTASTVLAVLRFLAKPTFGRIGLAAVCCSLSYLTRDVGFGYILLTLMSLALAAAVCKWPRKKAAAWAAAGLAVFALCSTPYWIFIMAHTGKFALSLRPTSGLKANMAGYERGSKPAIEDEDDDEAGPSQGSGAREESGPELKLWLLPFKMARLTCAYLKKVNDGLTWPYYALTSLGLLLIPGGDKGKWPREAVLWIWAAAVMEAYALVTPYMVDGRYYQPAVLLSCVWAGRGAIRAPDWAGKKAGGKAGTWVLAAAVVLSALGAGRQLSYGKDYVHYLRLFYAPENMIGKSVAGYREVALDAAKLLEIKPGARIADRKPFAAFYLKGRYVQIADTMEGVKRQVREGQCDYVFISSLTVRRYTPALRPLITAADDPIPGAGLVYRNYLRQYNRMFSVYQVGAPSLHVNPLLSDPPTRSQVNVALQKANEYFKEGYIEQARQLLEDVAKADPNNALAHRELIKVYMVYGYFDGISFDRADDEVMRYASLAPDDAHVRDYQRTIYSLQLQQQAEWGTDE